MKRNTNNCIHTFILMYMFLSSLTTWAEERNKNLKLNYDRPAEYFEETLVIGNGTMGAIVYGGTTRDVISLNDLTLWTGEPDREVTTPDAYKAIPKIREMLERLS